MFSYLVPRPCLLQWIIDYFVFQVETYGSMEKREKVEFILEQMRLCIAKKDFIRAQIISKKISVKFFDSDKEQVQFMFNLGSLVIE